MRPLRAEILAVGSELLRPPRAETNASFLTWRLLDLGVEVVARTVVADDRELLASAFAAALARSDVVLSTGGLGPTEDDLTREAAASALGRGLRREPELIEGLRRRFARMGRAMPPVNEKQADVIEGAEPLRNPRGTAPGQCLATPERLLFLLPGPPPEMEGMFEESVLPRLLERAGARVLRTRVLKIAGMAESEVEQLVAPVYTAFANPRTTILGGAGQVELHLTGTGESEAEAGERVETLAAALRERLPGRIFSEDGRELPEVVGALLRERGLRLAVAESCTGGRIAARLTDVPGASGFLDRGYVTYSNRAKVGLLGVEAALLERAGAVSAEVARALAEGARRAASVDVGLGVTGIAGPTGGSADKPVGLVYLAVCGAAGERVRRAVFAGDRSRVRTQATQAALELLRRALLGLPEA